MSVLTENREDTQLAEMVREDFRAAELSRKDLEERKIRDYQLYRRYRKEVENAGQNEEDRGPFGWSKMTVPLVYVICETILPRLGTQPPDILVSARSPGAVPYAQAVQLRLQHYLRERPARFARHMLMTLKQRILLGDGPVKTTIDPETLHPRMTGIDWFDFFLSSEATSYWDAEVLFHRTWYTKRQIEALGEREGPDGKPVYRNLDEVSFGSTRDSDSTYQARREASGLNAATYAHGEAPVPVIEAWYADGSVVTVAGVYQETVIRRLAADDPLRFRHKDRPWRPFTLFSNTPDLFFPYSIADAEVIEDYQRELSIFRNQAMDQAIANVNSPVAYDEEAVRGQDVNAGFGGPGRAFPVRGNPSQVVMRFPPGQMSTDVQVQTDLIRSEAQLASGVNDYAAGQPIAAGVANQTATGISIIAAEANKRFAFAVKTVEMGMEEVAENCYRLDCQFGARSLAVKLGQQFSMQEGAQGITPLEQGRFAQVELPDKPAMDFDIEVDAGSMALPHQLEQAQRVQALAQVLGMNPILAQQVDWRELASQIVESHGFSSGRLLVPANASAPVGAPAQGGAPAQAVPGQPAEVPVGPPEPVNGNGGAPPRATPTQTY